MQTFLPYSDFEASAKCLDNKRLGKQRVEGYQILKCLLNTSEKRGWINHPAVKMWKGYEQALIRYTRAICQEWINKGFKDTVLQKIYNIIQDNTNYVNPWWLGDERLHSSHRSKLLSKDFYHYKQFNWKENSSLPYFWPV